MAGDTQTLNNVQIRHSAIEFLTRSLDVYHYHRLTLLKNHRWALGAAVTNKQQENISDKELNYLREYNKILGEFNLSLENQDSAAADPTKLNMPPQSYYAKIRCLAEYGEFETVEGETVFLAANSQHILPYSDSLALANQGVIEIIE